MAEYIDKEKLLQKLSRMIEYCKNDNKVNGLTALFQVGDAIMDCPTADVVEVVRCKDCLYCEDFGMSGLFCNHPDDRNPVGCRPGDFCSDGRKRKKVQNDRSGDGKKQHCGIKKEPQPTKGLWHRTFWKMV